MGLFMLHPSEEVLVANLLRTDGLGTREAALWEHPKQMALNAKNKFWK